VLADEDDEHDVEHDAVTVKITESVGRHGNGEIMEPEKDEYRETTLARRPAPKRSN